MKNIKKDKLEKIKKKLLSDSKTLIIAVEDFKYSPQIGYAPHIRLEESFYIFSSELSPHIKLLLKTTTILPDHTDINKELDKWTEVKSSNLSKLQQILSYLPKPVENKDGK